MFLHEQNSMPDLYSYGTGELIRFWRLRGKELREAMMQGLPDPDWECPPREMRLLLRRVMPGEPDESINDLLWWLNLFWFCDHDGGYELLEGDYHWVFNTPDHPFEQFLVAEQRAMGIDAYATYATVYP